MKKKVDISKRKLRNKEGFFDALAEYSNFTTVDNAKQVYYGLIKLLSRDLRVNSYTQMPDWGYFSVVKHQGRLALNVNSQKLHRLPMTNTLKYEADYKLRDYFHKLGNNAGE